MSNNELNMKQHLALFRHSQYGWLSTFESHGDEQRAVSNYARVSEWQFVEFKPLPIEAIVESEMLGLTKERAEIVEEFTAKLRRVDERMANLRALAAPVRP